MPLIALTGCTGAQSVLAPGAINASQIATLWWFMFGVGMAILALVVALYAYVLYTKPEQRLNIGTDTIVIAGGIILPIVCFSILLPMSFAVARLWTADVPPGTLRVEVQGNQWWWRVRYLEPGRGDLSFYTANEIHVPTGRPVEVFLTSNDVIHSLWIPGMGGKTQLIPGLRNREVFQADKPGHYRAQCAEFCGLDHALMALWVVADTPADFTAWLTHERAPARVPSNDTEMQGYLAFRTHACVFCHTLRGLQSFGVIGPDLTHVGSRLTIGAGLLPNTVDNVAFWIAHNQRLKPTNQMLSFAALDPGTLKLIATFLEGLK